MAAKKKIIEEKNHPSLDIVSSYGVELSGKKIVLCVAGSVAAYKAIELARLLMRHGADVRCVTSDAVTKLVQPDYFKWATGNAVITKLTGELEHIKLADYNQSDLIIVYPATANTLGKLANGIDDTPVSTVLTVGFGSKIPILMCLAMHASMYENAAVKKNVEFLKNKIEFLSPQQTEGKAKATEPEDVLDYVLKKFGFSSILKNKKVLITAGPTIEYIDPVRIITNQSSGKTGMLLASELISSGAKVTLVYGPGSEKPPKGVKLIKISTSNEIFNVVKKEMQNKFDIVIMAAAISDYIPENPSKNKIKSSKNKIKISLKKTQKVINFIKKYQKNVFLVGFKAEANISKNELITLAKKKMDESNADMIIANNIGSKRYKKNPESNEILIIDSNRVISSGWMKKEKIAKLIIKEIENKIKI
ncbi:bifunctional phosphopantothenoylcysteine decarboxylase/phosphopantothenate--cysteine ligase CoaBC [Nitrosarchaeum sp.]|uniref:bifunctional phosphopantothenoylcysteine decarboxylase/phosphopantothenate--cysteine ligase CoaBC n=1 Tax=Nitrosarchaeum sp. TaxID=2026886 RepID=UPI00247C78B6|nr:bifunctional phosphopantothenoylcysteine decarboxylase/phosphopantothenate--cysteine ligase CoaBC [Nitrosarchaeum sp.]MCV0412489.1 bifunctional phosphopantothenoylcysteine decarboxylase/phosphopantothenate--cysteine ligase CoaBC [Nitrosarchaeum sp.]